MRFTAGVISPPEYRGRIFIAEHGSWNRSTPIGYRVTTVRLEGDRVVGYEPFATGWLADNGHVAGRPGGRLALPGRPPPWSPHPPRARYPPPDPAPPERPP